MLISFYGWNKSKQGFLTHAHMLEFCQNLDGCLTDNDNDNKRVVQSTYLMTLIWWDELCLSFIAKNRD